MILADIGKFLGARLASALIFIAVVAAGVWCWQHPEALRSGWQVVKGALIWTAVVAALPWSSYLFMRPLLSFQSEMTSTTHAAAVSVGVIAAYWVLDILLAFYLAGGAFSGAFTWLVVLLGFAAAGAYNFIICESLARHVNA